jgi:hypothetical protein
MEKVRKKYSTEFKKVRDKDKIAMFPTEFQRVLWTRKNLNWNLSCALHQTVRCSGNNDIPFRAFEPRYIQLSQQRTD